MTLVCDSCGDDIENQTRPEAYVPLRGMQHGVDICLACKDGAVEMFAPGDRDGSLIHGATPEYPGGENQ